MRWNSWSIFRFHIRNSSDLDLTYLEAVFTISSQMKSVICKIVVRTEKT